MEPIESTEAAANAADLALGETDDTDLVETELLVEEISIDGMCGVY